MAARNIVLFGGSGAGKSSIINMLTEKAIKDGYINGESAQFADTSSNGIGCTLQSTGYNITIHGSPFRIYDTIGLDEGEEGRVPTSKAIVQLYTLLKNLDGGVSLLIFCMKNKITGSAKTNWTFFNEIICRRNVPIVVIVTHLEQEKVMDQWWYRSENLAAFLNYEMCPAGHACISASKGKQKNNGSYMLQDEYDESCGKVQDLIKSSSLKVPWRMERVQWFKETLFETTYTTRWCRDPIVHKRIIGETKGALDEMVLRCKMPEAEARQLAEQLDSVR